MLADSAEKYTSQLVILEQPTKSFRFRYKSEMNAAHGSLNGERSEKNKKTYPEVELRNFNGTAVIRCSLYQTHVDTPSPHPHQLMIRTDNCDECDPHDVHVSQDLGYIARFGNMSIIHTAKKNIYNELYAKKKRKVEFEKACKELSQEEQIELKDEAKREEKLLNLNQVRLFFEAFQIVENGVWTRICKPVFSNVISNSKNPNTSDLKICHLSTVFASVAGGDEVTLLVDKINTKNIKVRFFELPGDDTVWEAYGEFFDHHQYALVVRTPPYKNQDIDKIVNIFIELMRKSGSSIERSEPIAFRYKPRDIVLSRKRRAFSHSTALHEPVMNFMQQVVIDSEQLNDYNNFDISILDDGELQYDGEAFIYAKNIKTTSFPRFGTNSKGFIDILMDKIKCLLKNIKLKMTANNLFKNSDIDPFADAPKTDVIEPDMNQTANNLSKNSDIDPFADAPKTDVIEPDNFFVLIYIVLYLLLNFLKILF